MKLPPLTYKGYSDLYGCETVDETANRLLDRLDEEPGLVDALFGSIDHRRYAEWQVAEAKRMVPELAVLLEQVTLPMLLKLIEARRARELRRPRAKYGMPQGGTATATDG